MVFGVELQKTKKQKKKQKTRKKTAVSKCVVLFELQFGKF